MKIVQKIGNVTFYTIFGLLVLWTIFTLIGRIVSPAKYPMLFGYSEAHIISGSMEPTLSTGDHVVFHRQESYELDDVVVYYDEADGVFVVHRIVGKSGDKFIVQGDYNPVCDPTPVSPANIQGKVIFAMPNLQTFLLIGYGSLATILIQKLIKDIKLLKTQKAKEGGEQADEKQDIKDI